MVDSYHLAGFERWLATRTVRDPAAREHASALFDDYGSFVTSIGEPVMTVTAFGRALSDLRIELAGKDGAGRKRRRGLKLAPRSADGQSGRSEHPEHSEPSLTRITIPPGASVTVTVRPDKQVFGGQVVEVAWELNTSEPSERSS